MTMIPNIETLSFENALKELETSVKQLEEGSLPLDESIEIFEKGMLLSKHCEEKLKEASLKIEKITLKNQKPESLESLTPSS